METQEDSIGHRGSDSLERGVIAPLEGRNKKKLPWWRKDKLGWPIELWKDKPVKNFVRIICQNIRKITG